MTVRTLNDAGDAASETASATDGETRQSTREELGRFADQGGFTLTADANPWLEAAETLASPEDARSASTVLAELRSRDTRAVGRAANAIADKAGLRIPDTLGGLTTLLDLLQRVHATSGALRAEAYERDLAELAAATGTGAYRKETGVKLGWARRRTLRAQARSLAPAGTRPGRADLHAALVAAAAAHRDWTALAAGDTATRPAVPVDGALLTETANVVESLADAVRSLARLLPERALDSLPLAELADLVDRLAADEGTLYRLSALRQLRLELAEQGLTELLAELTERQADRDAALAAYDRHQAARAALAAVPRQATDETAVEIEEPAPVEETVEAEPVAEVETEVEPEPVAEPEPEPVVEAAVEAEPVAEVAAVAEVEPAVEVEPVAEVEAEPVAEAEPEPVVEAAVEAEPVAEVAAVAEVEPAVEVEPVAEVEAEPVAEPEPAVEAEPVAEPEPAVEVEPVAEVEAEPVAEPEPVVEAEPVAEAVAEPAAEPVAEVEPVIASEPEPEPEPVAAAVVVEAVSGPAKPELVPGKPITGYSAEELVALVAWLDADGEQRSDDELLRAAMKELGFGRLGPRIKEALGAAVSTVRG
ncbi:hypothetical protein [Streptomyces sp. TLI_171]|uniref:hypothetical protein n=1 Tax=Streptomyces sp. TLI_171 TaxID=1938859 RepID=UPI000C1892C6|nr:hypothetical protein [Streptomyces sp. TLI_171]RKE22320.1 hypothetical protein BX266_5763 [Streptomyces sp. TLI_171]